MNKQLQQIEQMCHRILEVKPKPVVDIVGSMQKLNSKIVSMIEISKARGVWLELKAIQLIESLNEIETKQSDIHVSRYLDYVFKTPVCQFIADFGNIEDRPEDETRSFVTEFKGLLKKHKTDLTTFLFFRDEIQDK